MNLQEVRAAGEILGTAVTELLRELVGDRVGFVLVLVETCQDDKRAMVVLSQLEKEFAARALTLATQIAQADAAQAPAGRVN